MSHNFAQQPKHAPRHRFPVTSTGSFGKTIKRAFFVMLSSLCITSTASAQDQAVAAHYPPLMIDGEPDRPGLAIEIFKEAGRRAGRDVELTFLPFARALFALKGDAPIFMPALFQDKANDDLFLWIEQIESARLSFITLGAAINTLEAARALPSITVERGTTADVFLTSRGFNNLRRVANPIVSARMLAAGRTDAWLLANRLAAETWFNLDLDGSLTFGATQHEVPIYLVASRALDPDVTAKYRAALAEMKRDGAMDAILGRYERPGE